MTTFATALSIVMSCILSYFIFEFEANLQFLLGGFLVVFGKLMMLNFKQFLATYIYVSKSTFINSERKEDSASITWSSLRNVRFYLYIDLENESHHIF